MGLRSSTPACFQRPHWPWKRCACASPLSWLQAAIFPADRNGLMRWRRTRRSQDDDAAKPALRPSEQTVGAVGETRGDAANQFHLQSDSSLAEHFDILAATFLNNRKPWHAVTKISVCNRPPLTRRKAWKRSSGSERRRLQCDGQDSGVSGGTVNNGGPSARTFTPLSARPTAPARAGRQTSNAPQSSDRPCGGRRKKPCIRHRGPSPDVRWGSLRRPSRLSAG
jgi:hypothetical protein